MAFVVECFFCKSWYFKDPWGRVQLVSPSNSVMSLLVSDEEGCFELRVVLSRHLVLSYT